MALKQSEKPITIIEKLSRRGAKTGDSELEQSLFRLLIGLAIIVYFIFPWDRQVSLKDTLSSYPNIIILTSFVIAIGITLNIIWSPKVSPVRRVIGIVLDMSSLSALLFLTGEEHIPLFVFYLWVVLGNGFRYGIAYLYISHAISIVGFSTVLIWGEYWKQNQPIAISLLIILVAIPLYSAFLLKKLHDAIAAAKQANEAKSRFLANMSHELRTPLNGVIGMGELLRETSLSFEQHELVNSMHTSANTLLELIENVLDISKIEAGKLIIDSKPFDLHSLVNSVIYMLAPMGEIKGLSVSCNIDPETPYYLNGDQPHLRQVLINLINNAIKFTDRGHVNLKIFKCAGTENKPRIRFEVIDSGIGISEDAQTKIFENFTQADASSSRSYGGTGLGTTISRNLVELMGGEIGLESKVGEGSKFWFELPFEVIQRANETLSDERVLLLANEETAEKIRPSLKNWSIRYDWVRSAARAFSHLVNAEEENNGFDIIIVDQSCMDEVNPIQFAQMVKAERGLKQCSMVLLNSSDSMIESNLINQFYISTLEEPIEKRLLFNSLHSAQSVKVNDPNIVTLAEHYARQGNTRKLNILVAEDNLVNQQVIEGILCHVGHQVILSDSGEDTLEILSKRLNEIDLLILDMNMPEKTGIEVVKELRFLESNKKIPVIMLTADATPEAKEMSLNAGANCFLTKPVDARVLLEKVAVLTRHLRSKRKARRKKTFGSQSQSFEIRSSQWFDENILRELSKLGDGLGFIQGLVKGFLKDGERHIADIITAENDDYPAYRESLHALKGSATELGATALVDVCLKGEKLKPYDIGTEKIKQLNREVEKTFNLTVSALQEAVSSEPKHSPTKAD